VDGPGVLDAEKCHQHHQDEDKNPGKFHEERVGRSGTVCRQGLWRRL
jgi:hypothetical protein